MKFLKITQNEIFLLIIITSFISDLMMILLLKMAGVN